MCATTTHPAFIQPVEDLTLWKYLDFPNFVSLLHKESLYLPRLATLEDPWEGRNGQEFDLAGLRKTYLDLIQGRGEISMASFDEHVKVIVDMDMLKIPRQHFISSWHANTDESMAMWRIYSKAPNSLALRTRYSRLVAGTPARLLIGLVEYRNGGDRNAILESAYKVVMRKRLEYRYENEVRLVRRTETKAEEELPGVLEPVELGTAIEEIVISPLAEDWFAEVVRATCSRFGHEFAVSTSSLLPGRILR